MALELLTYYAIYVKMLHKENTFTIIQMSVIFIDCLAVKALQLQQFRH